MDQEQELARQRELIARLREEIGRDLDELVERLNPRSVLRRQVNALDPRPALRRGMSAIGWGGSASTSSSADGRTPDPQTVRTLAAAVRGVVLNRKVIIGAVVFGAGCAALWVALRYRRS